MKSEYVLIACPTCTQRIRTPQRLIGRSIYCPTCHHRFVAEMAGAVDEKASRTFEPERALTEVEGHRMAPAEGKSKSADFGATVPIDVRAQPQSLPGLGVCLTPAILPVTHWLGLLVLALCAGLVMFCCVGLIAARVMSPLAGAACLVFACVVICTLALTWRILFETILVVWQRATIAYPENGSENPYVLG